MTPRQLQICRRWHHDVDCYAPTQHVPITAADLRSILSALWAAENELFRRDQIRTRHLIRRAEQNLHIFGPEPKEATLFPLEPAGGAPGAVRSSATHTPGQTHPPAGNLAPLGGGT